VGPQAAVVAEPAATALAGAGERFGTNRARTPDRSCCWRVARIWASLCRRAGRARLLAGRCARKSVHGKARVMDRRDWDNEHCQVTPGY